MLYGTATRLAASNEKMHCRQKLEIQNRVPGIDLLSPHGVSSALAGLTAEFEMGSGVTLPQGTPETLH